MTDELPNNESPNGRVTNHHIWSLLGRLDERTLNIKETVDAIDGKMDDVEGRVVSLEGRVVSLEGRPPRLTDEQRDWVIDAVERWRRRRERWAFQSDQLRVGIYLTLAVAFITFLGEHLFGPGVAHVVNALRGH